MAIVKNNNSNSEFGQRLSELLNHRMFRKEN